MIDGCSGGDDAFLDVQKVADGVHVAVAARAYKVNCNTALIETDDGVLVVDSHSKPSAARVVVEDLVESVRPEVWAGASLEETTERVRGALAPKYEAARTRESGAYRPWRTLVLANIERAYQMVS